MRGAAERHSVVAGCLGLAGNRGLWAAARCLGPL